MAEIMGAALLTGFIVYCISAFINDLRMNREEARRMEELEDRRRRRKIEMIYRDKITARAELMNEWQKVGKLGYYDAKWE